MFNFQTYFTYTYVRYHAKIPGVTGSSLNSTQLCLPNPCVGYTGMFTCMWTCRGQITDIVFLSVHPVLWARVSLGFTSLALRAHRPWGDISTRLHPPFPRLPCFSFTALCFVLQLLWKFMTKTSLSHILRSYGTFLILESCSSCSILNLKTTHYRSNLRQETHTNLTLPKVNTITDFAGHNVTTESPHSTVNAELH